MLRVNVLNCKGLGVKEGRWAATVVDDPNTSGIWYRAFHYKADADSLCDELLKSGYRSVDAVLGHYGTKYFQPLA